MALLSKPIDDIKYQDVVEFCQEGRAEGLHLDYKKDFPEHLAKHIAAIANTLGGMIVIGVDEEDDKPRAPFEGISYDNDKKYRGRVESVAKSSISPAPFFEVANCPNAEKTKTFIVIRIPQSISVPHALQDGSIFIRTGQSSSKEKIASPDQVAWLFERRQKARDLKEKLCTRSAERFENFLIEKGFVHPDTKLTGTGNPVLLLSACPSFPDRQLFDYRTGHQILSKIVKRNGFSFGDTQTKPVAGGAIYAWGQALMKYGSRKLEGVFSSLEIDEYGLLVYRHNATDPGLDNIYYIRLIELLTRFLLAARMLYAGDSSAYWGYIDFSAEIREAAGKQVDLHGFRSGLSSQVISDNNVVVQESFSAIELQDEFNTLVCRLLEKLAFASSVTGTTDRLHITIVEDIRKTRELLNKQN